MPGHLSILFEKKFLFTPTVSLFIIHFRKNFVHFDEQKMLDKIAGIWYNGEFGAPGLRTVRQMNIHTFAMNGYSFIARVYLYKKNKPHFCGGV